MFHEKYSNKFVKPASLFVKTVYFIVKSKAFRYFLYFFFITFVVRIINKITRNKILKKLTSVYMAMKTRKRI